MKKNTIFVSREQYNNADQQLALFGGLLAILKNFNAHGGDISDLPSVLIPVLEKLEGLSCDIYGHLEIMEGGEAHE